MESFMHRTLFLTLLTSPLFCLPQSAVTKQGNIDFHLSPAALEILASDQSIIEWSDFSIETGETVRFIQPTSTAAVLNRVMDAYPSRLMGNLESNGQVLLINPNGILVGKEANVNVGSWVASTLDLQNEIFLNNKDWKFEGESTASVEIYGNITSQNDLFCAAYDLINEGNLKGQEVGLLACSDLGIKMKGSDRLHFRSGHSVNHRGSIVASKNEIGGHVYLLGKEIILSESASIDVSHSLGGGQIWIGGQEKGQNRESIPIADKIFVSSEASLKADALENGPGGKIILFSDSQNLCYGTISSRGGPLGGDGGFVELSAHSLQFNHFPDVSSSLGNGGELLLDPTDVLISNTGPFSAPVVLGNPTTWTAATAPSQPLVIRASGAGSLSAFLTATGSVTINTNVGATTPDLGVNGDITINNLVIWGTANRTLTLVADRDVIINNAAPNNGSIIAQGINSHISITAGRNVSVTGDVVHTGVVAPGANINVVAGQNVSVLSPVSASRIGSNIGNVTVQAIAGSVNVQSTSLNLSAFQPAAIGPSGSFGATNPSTGNITVEAGQDVTLSGSPTPGVSGGGAMALIGRIPLGYAGTPVVVGNTTVTAGRDIILTGGIQPTNRAAIGVVAGGGVNLTGNITVNAGRNLTLHSHGGIALIGSLATANTNIIQSNVLINVGGNLLMDGTTFTEPTLIGFIRLASAVTSLNIHVAGNLWMDGRLEACTIERNYTSAVNVAGYNPETFIHCLGDITILGENIVGGAVSSGILRSFTLPNTAHTTHLWAGGSIHVLNGVPAIPQPQLLSTIQNQNNSFRAAGDFIQNQGGTFPSTGTGSATGPAFSGFFVEADTCYAAGELWTPQVATVNGVNIFAATALGANSPVIACNGSGAYATDTARYNLAVLPTPYNGAQVPLAQTTAAATTWTLSTVAANLTVHSANNYAGELFRAAYAAGNPADLTIGAPINQLSLVTTSGAIEISGSDGPTLGGCGCNDSFRNISVSSVANPWTSNSIYLSATNNLNITTVPVVANGASAITLISDWDRTGAGNLSITQNVSSLGGLITLDAGFGAAAGGTSAINQTGGLISSGGGPITAQALSNITFSGAATTVNSGGGALTVDSTTGTISIEEDILTLGGNGNLTAGIDILVTLSGSISTAAGDLVMNAFNQITINGDANSLASTTGNITLVSDADLNGMGDINISQNITSVSGSITLQAGEDNNGCSVETMGPSINHTAGAINSGSGNFTATANFNINLSSPVNPSITTSTGFFHTQAGRNTNLTNTTLSKTGGGGAQDLLMISGRNMNMTNSHILAIPAFVTLVVDNCFPAAPLIGPGAFNMDAASSIDPVNLRIFTALQGQNSIQGVVNLNGSTFIAGTPYTNTATEHWCQYFGLPFPYPFSNLGQPYTIFYKDCLQQVVYQAQVIVTQFLLDLHPYNENPGWTQRFWMEYSPKQNITSSSINILSNEPFYLRRRHLNMFNNPKTWTVWLE